MYIFGNMCNTQFSIWIIDIITISTPFIYFNTKRIKYRLIIVDICYFCSYFLHSRLFIETHSKEFIFDGLKLKNVIAVKKHFQ